MYEVGPFTIQSTEEPETGAFPIRLVPANDRGAWHQSTQAFLHALAETDLSGLRVLDVGTGGGVLAIAAARRGAIVEATERKPGEVGHALLNIEANGLSIPVYETAGLPDAPPFDLILANLGDDGAWFAAHAPDAVGWYSSRRSAEVLRHG